MRQSYIFVFLYVLHLLYFLCIFARHTNMNVKKTTEREANK